MSIKKNRSVDASTPAGQMGLASESLTTMAAGLGTIAMKGAGKDRFCENAKATIATNDAALSNAPIINA